MTLLITKWEDSCIPAWHPNVGRRRALLLCCQNRITWPQRTEKVCSVGSCITGTLHIDLVLVRISYWWKEKRHMTRAYNKNMVSISQRCRPWFFDVWQQTRLVSTEARRSICPQTACCARHSTLWIFSYYSLLLCTTVKLLIDYNLVYA